MIITDYYRFVSPIGKNAKLSISDSTNSYPYLHPEIKDLITPEKKIKSAYDKLVKNLKYLFKSSGNNIVIRMPETVGDEVVIYKNEENDGFIYFDVFVARGSNISLRIQYDNGEFEEIEQECEEIKNKTLLIK
jgi:hypothetical protein